MNIVSQRKKDQQPYSIVKKILYSYIVLAFQNLGNLNFQSQVTSFVKAIQLLK